MNNTMMYNSYNPGMMMDMVGDQRMNTMPQDDFEFIDEDFDVRRVEPSKTEREAGVYVNGKRIQSKREVDDNQSVKSVKSVSS